MRRPSLPTTIRNLVWVVAALALPGPASAWTIYGKGADPCAKFSAVMKGLPLGQVPARPTPQGVWYAEGMAYSQWVQGYISALNALNSDSAKQIRVDWPTTDGWLRDFCERHPDTSFEEALGTFIVQHLPTD